MDIDKLIIKFLWKGKRPKIASPTLRKKEKVSGGVGSQWAAGLRIVTPSLCCPLSTIISGLRGQAA